MHTKIALETNAYTFYETKIQWTKNNGICISACICVSLWTNIKRTNKTRMKWKCAWNECESHYAIIKPTAVSQSALKNLLAASKAEIFIWTISGHLASVHMFGSYYIWFVWIRMHPNAHMIWQNGHHQHALDLFAQIISFSHISVILKSNVGGVYVAISFIWAVIASTPFCFCLFGHFAWIQSPFDTKHNTFHAIHSEKFDKNVLSMSFN